MIVVMPGMPLVPPTTAEPQVGQKPRRFTLPLSAFELVEPRRAGQLHGVRREGHKAEVAAAGRTLAVKALALAGGHRLGRDLVADGAAQAAAAIGRWHGCSPFLGDFSLRRPPRLREGVRRGRSARAFGSTNQNDPRSSGKEPRRAQSPPLPMVVRHANGPQQLHLVAALRHDVETILSDTSQIAPVPWPECSHWEHKATRQGPQRPRMGRRSAPSAWRTRPAPVSELRRWLTVPTSSCSPGSCGPGGTRGAIS